MAFTVHLRPHHVHIETSCTDHSACSEDHWKGGRPEREHPHHVEVDCSTGLVGYTRLTGKEIAEREAAAKVAMKEQAAAQSKRDSDLFILRERAKTDPHFAALLRHLGLHET